MQHASCRYQRFTLQVALCCSTEVSSAEDGQLTSCCGWLSNPGSGRLGGQCHALGHPEIQSAPGAGILQQISQAHNPAIMTAVSAIVCRSFSIISVIKVSPVAQVPTAWQNSLMAKSGILLQILRYRRPESGLLKLMLFHEGTIWSDGQGHQGVCRAHSKSV